MENEEKQKELFFKFQIFEQQIQNLQQQIESVERAIVEMGNIFSGIPNLNQNKEIFAPIGKGIFAKAKLVSEELLVDIGGGRFVKKTIPQTKELIRKQTVNLENIKKELEHSLEEINSEITRTFIESQEKKN
jgi:prefoldin alpha subunit